MPSINAETCILFLSTDNEHLFTLKIRLDGVLCYFNTQRLYFTFPVKPKHLSQVSCVFNKYCGKGANCHVGTLGKHGLRFEGETAESREFPGKSTCQAGQLGVGCMILTRAACNFYRTWYEPDLLHSYEVSTITGHKCSYQFAITHVENGTVAKISLLTHRRG